MQMSLNAQATCELREEAKQTLNLWWVCSARTNFNKTIAARTSNSVVALHGSCASHYCTDRSQFPVPVESQKNICFQFRIHRSYAEGVTNIGAFVDSKNILCCSEMLIFVVILRRSIGRTVNINAILKLKLKTKPLSNNSL